jgi:hypothetical protein
MHSIMQHGASKYALPQNYLADDQVNLHRSASLPLPQRPESTIGAIRFLASIALLFGPLLIKTNSSVAKIARKAALQMAFRKHQAIFICITLAQGRGGSRRATQRRVGEGGGVQGQGSYAKAEMLSSKPYYPLCHPSRNPTSLGCLQQYR